MFALVNAVLELPGGPATGRALVVDGERIAGIAAPGALPAGCDVIDLGGGLLAPGFIDVQVNGGGGVLFNDDPSPQGAARIAAAHRRFGTTSLLPTLISDSLAVRRAGRAAVEAALAAGTPGIAGIHFEGPHLLPARRGVHQPVHMAPPTPDDLAVLDPLPGGRVVATVAPECVGMAGIAALAARGVRVCLGHSDATYEAASDAFAAGAAGVTHLFNAMSPWASRAPGLVGAALDSDRAWCGIIADGHHVHWATLRLAWRLTRRRMMLVTDAMPPVGTEQAEFLLHGERVTAADGRCVTADGRLAGSCLDMAAAVRNCVRHAGIAQSEAIALATASPADFLGLSDRGRLAPGLRADLVHLTPEFQVLSTWIGGRREGYTAVS